MFIEFCFDRTPVISLNPVYLQLCDGAYGDAVGPFLRFGQIMFGGYSGGFDTLIDEVEEVV
jgi:hypothetical protein